MNHEPPFFSVVVPTYERPAQLAECLRALARLDYPTDRFEVIVVDDGSAAPPSRVLGEFRDQLSARLLTQANAGPAAARNRGAAEARGSFLAFTDDDCAPDPGWLRALAARFRETPDRLVGGRTLNALTANPYSETSQLIIEVVYEHYNSDPEGPRFFASNNLAAPAELFRALKGFDETFTASEDREICDRWRARGLRLAYAPEAVVLHAHALTPGALWRQHFAYGRGACRFHRARAARGAERFRPEGAFYFKLFRASLTRAGGKPALAPPALLLWAQLANAAGFFYEHFQLRGATDPPNRVADLAAEQAEIRRTPPRAN